MQFRLSDSLSLNERTSPLFQDILNRTIDTFFEGRQIKRGEIPRPRRHCCPMALFVAISNGAFDRYEVLECRNHHQLYD